MREECAATRNFIDQFVAKPPGIDGRKHKIILTSEMLGCGLLSLIRRGEMDVAILQINGCATKNALRLRRFPLLPGQYLEYEFLIHAPRVVFFARRENPSVAFLTE